MVDMEIAYSFLAGIPTDATWSQTYVVKHADSFFGVVVSVQDAQSPSQIGKELLTHCMHGAQEGMTREQFLSLFTGWNREGVHIASVFISKNAVMIFTKGETSVRLVRNGDEQTLMQGKETGAYIQGEVRPDDYYIVGTKTFFSQFSSFDTHKSPQELGDEYATKLHAQPDSSGMSALFVQLASPTSTHVAPLSTTSSPSRSVPVVLPKIKIPTLGRHVRISLRVPRTKQEKKIVGIALAIGGALLLLFLFSWYLTVRRANTVAQELSPYQTRFNTLAALGSDKRLEQMHGFRELSRDIQERKTASKNSALTRGYDSLLSQVREKFILISGEKHLEKLHVFYDFRLVAADFVAGSVAYDEPGKAAVFLDGARGRLLSLSLEKKEALTLTVDEKLPKPFALAVENRKAYVLGNDGVMELSLPLDRIGSVIVNRDAAWNTPKLIDAFGTNLYVFDTGSRNLLRYDTQDLHSSPSAWFRNKEGVDFEQITSLRIDGGVWLGSTNGTIFHFLQGSPTAFAYQGVLDPPTSPVYIFTTKDSESIYVLEPHASRILVLTKRGEYQRSVISPDLSTATGLVVDESTKKAYVLSGSLVYEVEL